jgi:hypothetical protein
MSAIAKTSSFPREVAALIGNAITVVEYNKDKKEGREYSVTYNEKWDMHYEYYLCKICGLGTVPGYNKVEPRHDESCTAENKKSLKDSVVVIGKNTNCNKPSYFQWINEKDFKTIFYSAQTQLVRKLLPKDPASDDDYDARWRASIDKEFEPGIKAKASPITVDRSADIFIANRQNQ